VIEAYAPTQEDEDSVKEEFYYALQAMLDTVARHDFIILMGDFNAKTGKKFGEINTLGKFGAGNCNDNGERLLKMCCNNNLCITTTHFRQKPAHRNTWQSLDCKTCNLIDNIITRNVMQFKYLGRVLSNDAQMDEDIKARISKASSAYGRLHERVGNPMV